MIARFLLLVLIIAVTGCTQHKTEKEIIDESVALCGSIKEIQSLEKYIGYYRLECVDSRRFHILLEK